MGSACSATIWLQNCLASSLTLGPHECDDGKWKISPEETPEILQSGVAPCVGIYFEFNIAVAVSNDCEAKGPNGYIQYGYPDGTYFYIHFSVPYGAGSDNVLTCDPKGPNASRYITYPVNFIENKQGSLVGQIIIKST